MNQQATGSANSALTLDRTAMAKFRTQLALDRTTLAWIRTTLTMATFGFGTVGFFRTLREVTQPAGRPDARGCNQVWVCACLSGNPCHGVGGCFPLAHIAKAWSK